MDEQSHTPATHAGQALAAQRRPTAVRVTALLLAVAIMVVGNGLAGTLLGVRAGLEGIPAEGIGLLMSAYFGGYVLGSYFAPAMIGAVGHIRTFAALASLTSATALIYAIVLSSAAWVLLRGIHGACYGGLVVVVESWLNGSTTRRFRGRVLGVYSIVLLAASAGSQPLLMVAAPSGFILFCIVSVCFSLALVPVALTRAGVPGIAAASRAGLSQLLDASPTGLAAALAAGVTAGAFYGMGPTFAQELGFDESHIAAFMSAPILGGLMLQWPIGWLSDAVDRRWVIFGASTAGAAAAGLISVSVSADSFRALLGLAFVYGGATIPLYALSVAHVNDRVEAQDLVPAASGLVMVYGSGALLGPLAASLLMGRIGAEGLFVFGGGVLVLFAAFALFRIPWRSAVAAAIKKAFVAVPHTSHPVLLMHRHRRGRRPGPRAPA
jgi:MFS family permease